MLRHSLYVSTAIGFALLSTVTFAQEVVKSIEVEGNRRVETPTILSYIDVKPGQSLDYGQVEETLKNLYATGLFSDVVIDQQGNRLVINVVENKIINRIAYEGNDKLKDEVLEAELGLKPREVYTPAKVQEAAQKIRDMYRLSGRYGAKVIPKIIEREENRIDLVFEIKEGSLTRINKIIFVGNKHVSTSKLESVVLTKESHWYRFFSSDDTYDPDRLAYDKELLRRYYYEQGYADFKIDSVVAELDPDDQEFYITYTLSEGERYKFGSIKITNNLPKLNACDLDELLKVKTGEWFNSKEIEKSVNALNLAIGEKGFAFIEINPRLKRNPCDKTVDVNFEIKEGRHVYINRIDIVGNDRTEEEVVRREIRLSEGDPYNSVKLKRSEQKIQNLDFFKKVDVTQHEASAPDKVDLKVEVEDKPTGSMQFSAGYSTADGPLGTITLNERNLMGKGYDFYVSTMVSKRAQDYHTGFTNPYTLGRPLSSGIDLFHTSRKYPTRGQNGIGFRQMKTGSTFSAGYDLTEYTTQFWNYSIRRDRIDDTRTSVSDDGKRMPSPYLVAQTGTKFVSSLGQNMFYDKRNSSVFPSEGYYLGVANELAGLGGQVRYLKNTARGGAYYSIDDDQKFVVVAKGSVGVMSDLGKTSRVVDRYDLGGESFRGFSDAGIGPRDGTTRDAIGGLYFYKGTIEMSFPLGLPPEIGIKGAIFNDIGSVWHSGSKQVATNPIRSNSMRFRSSAGVGITWRSPFGPIGVTLAKPYIRVKGVDRVEEFRVNFGTTF